MADERGDAPPVRQPPQVTMGLLAYLTATSLDEGYAHAAERDPGRGRRGRGRFGGPAALVLVLFGLLIATAAVQTADNAASDEARRDVLVGRIRAANAEISANTERTAQLRAEVSRLEAAALEATATGRALSSRIADLEVQTGTAAVTGPGVRAVIDDAPDAADAKEEVLDRDLQRVVNALWLSGAEAIAINSERLTNLSAIRSAGSAITVNYRSLRRPYVVSAIGNPDTMPSRFVETASGQAWLDVVAQYGQRFDMTSEESLTLPAAETPTLRYAARPEDGR